MHRRLILPAAVAAVLVMLVTAVFWRADLLGRLRADQRRVVAFFAAAVGVYPGSDVRILGVRVGEVVAVTPRGRAVRVEMHYDAQFPLPAGVQAVIVPPSVVSDRYVQLTPAYQGGPQLPDGAELPVGRTAVPLEVDDVYRSLNELNQALGPTGAGSALADLVATARRNLDGNGDQLHETLHGLSQAMSTLAQGRDDLFGTVDNLAEFTTALSRSDQQVREFNQHLAGVAEQLAAERDDLTEAVRLLSLALADVKQFVHDNRAALASNVVALTDITSVLVRQQRALMEVLDVAPLALSNLNLAYNGRSGTLDTRDNAMGPYDPAAYACSLIVNVAPVQQVPAACVELARLLAARGLPLTDELRRLIGLPAPTGPAPGGTASPSRDETVPGITDTIDTTLGGILRGGS
ncbi:MAG TPA: MCE family protein [Micromonosporaceae bacterium]